MSNLKCINWIIYQSHFILKKKRQKKVNYLEIFRDVYVFLFNFMFLDLPFLGFSLNVFDNQFPWYVASKLNISRNNSFKCLCYLNFSLKILKKYNLIFENVLSFIRQIVWSIKMYFQYLKKSGRSDV